MKPSIQLQSGQATLELAAILVGLIAVILGILFVGGITIGNNAQLLDAKYRAEAAARSGNHQADSGNAREIINWSYGGYRFDSSRQATIPFTAQDQANYSNTTSLGSAAAALTLGSDSTATQYSYSWLSPADFDAGAFTHDTSSDWGNARQNANLLKGEAGGIDPVSGFDEGYRRPTKNAMRNAFHVWFGIKITDNTLENNPTNRVYMPTQAVNP